MTGLTNALGPAPTYNTPEWREWRNGGIGSSDVPAMLGVDGFGRTAFGVAVEKRGLPGAEVEETPIMSWGRLIQPLILARYGEAEGVKVQNLTRPTMHPAYSRLYAHLDGRVQGKRRGVEIKNYNWQAKSKRAVEVQALFQIGVARLDAVDIVRIDYGSPDIVTIDRPTDGTVPDLLDFAQAWYQRYVLGDEMPTVDGSEAAGKYLNSLPHENEMLATLAQETLVDQLATIRMQIKSLKASEGITVNRLKETMVGAYKLVGDGWHINWRPNKDSSTVGHEEIEIAFRKMLEERGATQEELDIIVGLYTMPKSGAVPFKLYGKGEGND